MKSITLTSLAVADAHSRALEVIYRDHFDAVARWAARLGGADVNLEDVVQEVFAIAAERLDSFRGECQISTWLFSITENVLRKQRRHARVHRWFARVFGDEDLAQPAVAPAQIEQRQAQLLVARALDGLREPYRTAMILFELEELSGEEIARLKGVRVGTVWVWLHRGREQFLNRLQQLGEPSGEGA